MADTTLILAPEEGDVLPDGTVLTAADSTGWYAVGANDGHRYIKHPAEGGGVSWDDRGVEG